MVDDGELVLEDRNGDIQLNSVPKVAFQVRDAQCLRMLLLAEALLACSTDRGFAHPITPAAD